jgi:hypothetical protein
MTFREIREPIIQSHPKNPWSCNLFPSRLLYSGMTITIITFALAAIFGIVILKNWLTSANTPKAVVYGHGLFAAIGLVLLGLALYRNGSRPLQVSFILFVAAALGGFYMFFKDLKGIFSPTWLAIVHGLLAVGGFVVLLLTVL